MTSSPAPAASIAEVDPRDPLAREALGAYLAEVAARFEGTFDPGPVSDAGHWLLGRDGADPSRPVAYGGVVAVTSGPQRGAGEVKRMWVDPAWRGTGLGGRLLRDLEALAGLLGHLRVVLDTNLVLTEAVGLYERAGYARVEAYNDNPHAQAWFAKDLLSPGPAAR
ncbi:GNAT family N-acetyltransferase [Nocardioides sp. AX2bis]|uniref:GNAT family N-acetyltransferase n=1 Tax=Nocardioides sp. AX2bis TaxID=2653157 RepID=UPI0012F35FBB|nr:GNAT family N-acetyltransferase [Nocardioides sp. AX2bis]VXB89283.1 hypothetical protein NOCARDAX2BIS_380129 [Nocardioides sp. AX2bis]